MRQFKNLQQYSVMEINDILDALRESYDIVRLVDVEECRILEVQPDGTLRHGDNCFGIWNRRSRCANCSSYRACMMHAPTDKQEQLNGDRERIHSIPIYLELLNGELEMCVIECVKQDGREEREVNNEEEVFITTHDVLTRLYTQEKLFREIRLRLMENPSEAYLLVMGNIRNFHLINKLFGVECGNRVLAGIADILRDECTREEVYGRYRDDRFVLFIRKDRFQERAFSEHMQRVRRLLDSPIYAIQVKLGVYEITDPEMPVANMMDHAEVAVASIRDSRNQLIAHYHPSMMERKLLDQDIISRFEQALDDGEFQVYLQPQVRGDGRIVGAEALVRWIRSDGSVMMPGDFLNVLHQSELLSHLDVYVWDRAAQLLAKWKGTVLSGLYISINVDPTDFYHVNVSKVLAGLCEKYGIPSEKLRVEITETALFEDVENQNLMVESLHEAGFIVEIDDFGKGYSSLSLLKDIRADVLKIDMGFLHGARNSQRSRIILGAVVDMANRLNMDVITEGVETKEQVDMLTQIGCRGFQGYYFSRPIPVRDFEAVARENAGESGE